MLRGKEAISITTTQEGYLGNTSAIFDQKPLLDRGTITEAGTMRRFVYDKPVKPEIPSDINTQPVIHLEMSVEEYLKRSRTLPPAQAKKLETIEKLGYVSDGSVFYSMDEKEQTLREFFPDLEIDK